MQHIPWGVLFLWMPLDDSAPSCMDDADQILCFDRLQDATNTLVDLGSEDALADLGKISKNITVDDKDGEEGFMIYPGTRTMPPGADKIIEWEYLHDMKFSNSAMAKLFAAAFIFNRVVPFGTDLRPEDLGEFIESASFWAGYLCVGRIDV